MYNYFLWLLKLGALFNLYFLWQSLISPFVIVDAHLVIPAQIFFVVSIYRCLLPVNYTTNAVLHDFFMSSIFLTRFFATICEVVYIYQFSYLLKIVNDHQIPLVDIFSCLMIVQVIISQCFAWSAILTGRLRLYFYEELGWGVIFIFNTIASAILYWNLDNIGGCELLLQINLFFGVLYVPWQWYHLKSIKLRTKNVDVNNKIKAVITWSLLVDGLYKSIQVKNLTTQPEAWGGCIGMTWMIGYWATLIPAWLYLIIITV